MHLNEMQVQMHSSWIKSTCKCILDQLQMRLDQIQMHLDQMQMLFYNYVLLRSASDMLLNYLVTTINKKH